MRVKVTLACTECKQRNYNTIKNKKNDPDRIEMNKYCPFCRKHTTHKETKQGEETSMAKNSNRLQQAAADEKKAKNKTTAVTMAEKRASQRKNQPKQKKENCTLPTR